MATSPKYTSNKDWIDLWKSNRIAGIKQQIPYGLGTTEEPTPPVETYHLLTEALFEILTEAGENLDYDVYTPPPFDADAAAYLSAVISAGGSVDATISGATDTLFTSLKSAGLYSKISIMYPLLGGTGNSHSINALDPTSTTYDITFAGTMTHSVSGTTGGAVNGAYGKVSYNSSNLATNNMSVGVYSNKVVSPGGGGWYDWGWWNGGFGIDGIIQFASGTLSAYFRTGGSYLSVSNANSTGMYIWNADATGKQIYRNGSVLTSDSDTTWNNPNLADLYLWSLGVNNQNSGRRFAFYYLGTKLTSGEVSTLSTIINTFQTSLGRNTY